MMEVDSAHPSPPFDGTSRHAAAGSRLLAWILGAVSLAVVLGVARSDLFDLDRHAVPKELALHFAALLALPFIIGGLRRIEAGIVGTLLGAFTLWSGITALLATNHWIAFRAFGLTLSGFVVFVAARRVRRDGMGSILLACCAAAATIGTAIGVAQAYGVDLPMLAQERPPGGTFGNRNFLAHLTVITLPAVALFALRAGPRARRAALLAICVAVDAVILTRSRAAWLGLAASAATAAIALAVMGRAGRPTARRLASVAIAVAAGALAAIVLPNRLEWRSDSPYAETLARIADYRGGSGRGRIIQYRNSLRLVLQNPVFGTGPGNWFVEYPLVTTSRDPSFVSNDPIPTNPWPSSDWVALVAERGVIGLALVLATGLTLFAGAFLRLRAPPALIPLDGQDPSDRVPLEAVALIAAVTAAAVTGAFDAVMLNAAPVFFVACMAGVLAPTTPPIVQMAMPRRRRVAVMAAAFAAIVLLVAHSAVQLRSIRLTAGSQSRATVERALRLDPGNYRLHLLLARNGRCSARLPHARTAARLLPHHPAPQRAINACR